MVKSVIIKNRLHKGVRFGLCLWADRLCHLGSEHAGKFGLGKPSALAYIHLGDA